LRSSKRQQVSEVMGGKLGLWWMVETVEDLIPEVVELQRSMKRQEQLLKQLMRS